MARIRKFEVVLYNETVHELVEAGEHHKDYSGQWADTYEEEVTADDLPAALLKIHSRYSRNSMISKVWNKPWNTPDGT